MASSVHEPLAIPAGPDAITPAWLREALGAGGPQVGEQLEIAPIGGGMAGRIARVRTRGAPATVIAKFPAAEGATRRLADRLRLYEREEGFYRDLAHRMPVPVPRAYFAGSSGRDFVLLIEDVADAREGDLLRGCTLADAALVVEQLATMHARFWSSSELDAVAWLPAPNDEAVTSLATARGAEAWRVFDEKFGAHMPRPVAWLGAWLAEDRSVVDRLSMPPRTLVHGDMRTNNVLFARDGGAVRAFIVWLTAVRGRGPADVAHFFVSSLQPADRRTAERELLPRYYALLLEHGVASYSMADCIEDYRLAVANQFSQVVVLSSLLDVEERLDDGVGAVTGGRLITALLDLGVPDIVSRRSPLRRAIERVALALRR
jgi:aminoglycoside phosphotransferase (APT) family kinase protein